MTGHIPEEPRRPEDGPDDRAGNGPGEGAGNGPGTPPGAVPEVPPADARKASHLRTAGELVAGGGAAAALATLLYVVIGIGFWSLVGWGADRVLGTQWVVVLGACIGAASGIYIVYLHMQEALERNPSSDGQDPDQPHKSGPDSAPRP
ncbi:AtpZ/AtpI family protein [Kocuria sp. U4B]|jgi:hypothetical protein